MDWPFEGTPSDEERGQWEAFVEFFREHMGRTPTERDVESILASGGESLMLEMVARGKAEFSGIDESGAVTYRFEDEDEIPDHDEEDPE